ncbi:MAG: alkane 1-monooxygenase [Paracoccaceae bacterium]
MTQTAPARPPPMWLFTLAALTPLPLFAAGLRAGGPWAFAGLAYMAVLTAVLDQIGALFLGNAPEGAEFPGADALLVGIAAGTLVLLPAMVWAIAGESGLGLAARGALFIGAGLWFGQVSNPAAHELIHRGDRRLFRLGVAVYTALLYGHHASAHRLVHHRHAASAEDPNSARAGEGFYRFARRAWTGSFRKGLAAETALRARGRRGVHPYAVYLGGGMLALACGWVIAGWPGVFVWLGLGAHATMQLLLSDYVQHYGLTRRPGPDGRLEPVSDRHSWNAAQWFTSGLMVNAPRHSDHHAHPARPYPALRLPGRDQAPLLPWSLPVACTLALFPRAWRRAIRPHLARWQADAPTLRE